MKKILFLINRLDGGGAEKSLVSLLLELEDYQNEYEFHLLLPRKEGLFYKDIPSYVKQIEIPAELVCMTTSIISRAFWKNCTFNTFKRKIAWVLGKIRNKGLSYGRVEQELWRLWSDVLPVHEEEYDTAISYMNGYPNYYIVDKVKAQKKILWIHNEYKKIGYDRIFDANYYNIADYIATISDPCKDNFLEVFPLLGNKLQIIENISSLKIINSMADLKEDDAKFVWEIGEVAILSVGRLVEQKAFDLAIETASYLKKNKVNFKWFILGKGPLEKKLLKLTKQLGVDDRVIFIGEKSNPYFYMSKVDIFVQSSLYEGKSIVLDEAKMLCKPIVVTNYQTVAASIKDRNTGLISDMKPESLGDAINEIISNKELKDKLVSNLKSLNHDKNEAKMNFLRLLEAK